ncbi:cold-shock protein [Frankia sp. Mgl5]|uniref:Cold-shock protein n=1 Tax=Parafrankia soli TaxID=2599596 RepID=A0A1S1Q3A7_9ACTN|nr:MULTISPECIES: cold-shock protein [Frankiaceae]ABW09613.1 cold-shock DNA-binding domain protein [Frankia sp. EAN1pec]CAI7977377.1 cold shock protein [Frankia sp. Hr75.2]MCK9932969.1 cold-shock protein [Frankia sp. Mgl5]OHV28086.1 cold-shock protein [Parafrankia soli]TCJ35298.1 cold-shock protein [Parafrankia sp. BMG5.11]
MPTGKVKWFDVDRGFGFLSRDDGDADVFVHKAALPSGVDRLKPGDRVEFGIAAGRKGDQALSLRILSAPPSVAKAAANASRRSPDELHSMVEDMIKVLDDVQRDLRRGRYPDRRAAQKVAKVVHAVANELER